VKKSLKTHNFSVSRSFKVINVGTPGKAAAVHIALHVTELNAYMQTNITLTLLTYIVRGRDEELDERTRDSKD